jgi:putative ABC transport system substrate-binding protein
MQTVLSRELTGKRLSILLEIAPLAMTVAYLTDPRPRISEGPTRDILAAARALGRQAIILEARNEAEIDSAFASLLENGAGALVVGVDKRFLYACSSGRSSHVFGLLARFT